MRKYVYKGYQSPNFLDSIAKIYWDEIGYNKIPDSMKNSLVYSKKIKDNWIPSTSLRKAFFNDQNMRFMPAVDTSKVTNMESCFMASNLITLPQLDLSKVTDMGYCFSSCKSLYTIPELNTSSCINFNGFAFDSFVRRIEGISFKSMTDSGGNEYIVNSAKEIEAPCSYILIKDIGTKSSCISLNFSGSRNWGVADEINPDARQSLIDSLLTYSFDRKAVGYSDCTIQLYSSVKSILTTEEIAAIQAKGYIIN